MQQIYSEKHAELIHQQQRSEAMERKRKHLLKQCRDKEESIKLTAQTKIEQEEARLAEAAKEVVKEKMLRKAEKDLLSQMKKDNLARIKRKQEYKMKETLRKGEQLHGAVCTNLHRERSL